MEAFVTTLLLAALVNAGDRSQLLCAALALRFDRPGQMIAAIVIASGIGSALAAFGGVVVGTWISRDALSLFYALSLLFAAAGMLAWRRPVNVLGGWKIGPFLTTLLGIAIVQLGDKGQFIIAATAARSHDALWPLLGGWAGTVLGLVPAVVLRERMAELPLTAIRISAGIIILLVGITLVLLAFGLI
ncbi:TMEM165/GDT1 family protein [Blastomonas sp.]|uniref:TMEM165/GDT1 family protein n=1 Tax=Blastomonas sp. TaxID=1909299 RepID=UPI003593D8B3